MRDLAIDMTPTCVNRTAVYHIAMDTLAALRKQGAWRLETQYCGELAPMPQTVAERKLIAKRFAEDVDRWAAGGPHDDELMICAPKRSHDLPVFYLDPIYALYQPLRREDFVFVHDLSVLTNPQWHAHGVTLCYERAFRKLAASRARVITNSLHTTTILRANFSIPESDIFTCLLYLRGLPQTSEQQRPEAELTPGRFFLFVGSLETRKNVAGLIRAFATSGLGEEGWRLAIAGGDGWGSESIVETAEQVEGAELLGFVTDGELAWLYENAAAFAYPSFLEGFGVPLLEAMARGLPCMTSLTGAAPEVVGDLGLIVNPYDVTSIVDGLRQCAIMAGEQGFASKQALRDRAGEFSFARFFDKLNRALLQ